MKILQSSTSVWFTLWENFEEIEMTQKALLRFNGCIEVALYNIFMERTFFSTTTKCFHCVIRQKCSSLVGYKHGI